MSISVTTLQLNDISVEVVKKDIKNIHLSVYPPCGRVKVSAPSGMAVDTIRLFVISKIGWIRNEQRKFQSQLRESPRDYLPLESHFFWGERYLLQVVEEDLKPQVTVDHKKLVLRIRPDSSQLKKQQVLEHWYRMKLKEALPPLINHWEKQMGVSVSSCSVRKMKTKWGSCSPETRSIRINLELVKKPPNCLEYIVVHELAHLIAPNHGTDFVELLDKHLPLWRARRDELNALPLSV